MAKVLKEQLIDYLERVGKAPNLPEKAGQEIKHAIAALKKPNHITFPHAHDTLPETANEVRKMMDNFFQRHPALMSSLEKIDLQEKNFQLFIQESGLLKAGTKPRKSR